MSKPNWAKRLAQAEKRGRFTEQEKDWAASWTTCAVGEHSPEEKKQLKEFFDKEEPNIPRMRVSLFEYGCEFASYVDSDNIERAKDTYALIQQWFAEHLKTVS